MRASSMLFLGSKGSATFDFYLGYFFYLLGGYINA